MEQTTAFEHLKDLITCVSPIIIALFAYWSSRNEKQTKEYLEIQKKHQDLLDEEAKKDRKSIDDHFNKIDERLCNVNSQVTKLNKSIEEIEDLSKKINGLVSLSNINFEFCTSLSHMISAIGTSLDSSAVIDSVNLKSELSEFNKKQSEYSSRAVKIIY